MADAVFTFLPWARRGIVAELEAPDTGGSLDSRAVIRVGVTITNAGSGGVDVTLMGPGDVTGLDPRLIVRTEPRPNTTAFEPNHLAAIDFDLPDLPWLVTPASASGDLLRPWIALVVVEQQPGVTVGMEPGAPLPVLRIARPADALVELPDPSSSALWAHAQALTDVSLSAADLPAELAARPNENVSRLVCPRRLRAGTRYFACVVPTFDAGAIRGLGGAPVEGAPLVPAWGATDEVRLPVYYHWEFATGPDGDFETLAARLRPHKSSARVGRTRMHIGDAQPGVVELPEGDPGAIVDMDGALRAPAADDLQPGDIAKSLVFGLRSVLKATAGGGDGLGDAGEAVPPTVGPPLYGAWHANRHELGDDPPDWLLELNVDPRARVAAGLGTEAVRRNQEDLVHAAWQQLGDIQQANNKLNAARLSLELLRKVHTRHFMALPAEQLLPLASPIHRRTLVASAQGRVTVPTAVRHTSLPDATLSPQMRRLTSPRRPILRAMARRTGQTFQPAVVGRLAGGGAVVDPTRFVPDGIVAMATLDALPLPATADAEVSLSAVGLNGTIPAGRLRVQREAAVRLGSMTTATVDLGLRAGAAGGLVGTAHVEAIEGVPDLRADERVTLLRGLAEVAAGGAQPAAFLVSTGDRGRATIEAVDLTADGNVTIRGRAGQPGVSLGRIDPSVAGEAGGLTGVLRRLPPGTIDRTGVTPFTIRGGLGGTFVVDRLTLSDRPIVIDRPIVDRPIIVGPIIDRPIIVGPVGPTPGVERPPTGPAPHVVPPLVADTEAIGRFSSAFTELSDRLRLTAAPENPVFVAFDVEGAALAIRERTDPARTVPARVAAMIRIGGRGLGEPMTGISVAPTGDRVLAFPRFDVPSYRYLAAYDRTRFCPGIDEIPPDSVTLLETNPRFVEAFLVGINHEMNHELLWRTFPTDQRGTPFQRFWDRLDGQPDILPIHTFGPGRLGTHLVDARPKLVLLLRGELLRRYPTAAIYAVRATANGRLSTAAEDVLAPIFGGSFEPDVSFVGFDLEDHQLDDGNGWFFVIQEQPTEPRFGLDDPAARTSPSPITWGDVAWSDTGVAPGGHLGPEGIALVGLRPPPAHAGTVAAALFQRPVRVAVHARHLVTRMD